MAKIVDITEKLELDEERPKIKIKEKEIELNNDAKTVLVILGMMNDDFDEHTEEAEEVLFDLEGIKTLSELKLSFTDYVEVMKTAVMIISGNYEDDNGAGEDRTHTTT